MKKEFTFIDLANFREFEAVRQNGEYNMYSLQAQQASGLRKSEYLFVMKNYTELAEAEKKDAEE